MFLVLYAFIVCSQISSGGIPLGFSDKSSDYILKTIHIATPEIEQLLSEDEAEAKKGKAYRMGVLLPVNVDVENDANWQLLSGGTLQWRIRISLPGAQATALYFEKFHLPPGYRLYLYNDDRTNLLGAFTHQNNHDSGLFATALVSGENIIIECIGLSSIAAKPSFVIAEVLFAYRGLAGETSKKEVTSASSATCNVNINCSEGSAWQDHKRGVVRIASRIGSTAFWCSGSLINNMTSDYKPYLLTADHCLRNNQGVYATEANLNQWIFYFKYEAPGCPIPAVLPAEKSMTGATLKANTGQGNANMGSDFGLLLLNQNVPTEYQPYYNGWSRLNTPSPSGVSIHHPGGEIKKISTYTTPLISDIFNNPNQQNMYWRVQWTATANGHGVTEGGSSGAPLFNNNGLIVGQLTGGQSSCTYPQSPDYYGKFSYSWESFGSTPAQQLKPWLDPSGTGITQLPGSYNTVQVVANFMADTTVITVGSSIKYYDYSTNNPIEWSWTFPGGTPLTSADRNPVAIRYSAFGEFDVKLRVKNILSADSLLQKKYIRVAPAVFPNPARESVGLLLGSHQENLLNWELNNSLGQLMEKGEISITGTHSATIHFNRKYLGVHVLTVAIGNNRPNHYRLTLIK